jgi:uncharacterized membrane protein (UPF0127 family)
MTRPHVSPNPAGGSRRVRRRRWRAVWAAAVCLSAFACQASEEAPLVAAARIPETASVRVADEVFDVEVAVDSGTRMRGLSGRSEIARNGGMLFVLPKAQVFEMVMRDCPIPIDVAFLDSGGRVVAIHEMIPESPRRAVESSFTYEQRLPTYGSGVPVQFALETAGGRFAELGVKPGDSLHFAAQDLIARAR